MCCPSSWPKHKYCGDLCCRKIDTDQPVAILAYFFQCFSSSISTWSRSNWSLYEMAFVSCAWALLARSGQAMLGQHASVHLLQRSRRRWRSRCSSVSAYLMLASTSSLASRKTWCWPDGDKFTLYFMANRATMLAESVCWLHWRMQIKLVTIIFRLCALVVQSIDGPQWVFVCICLLHVSCQHHENNFAMLVSIPAKNSLLLSSFSSRRFF